MNLYRNFGSMLETWVAITDPEQNGEDADAAESRRPAASAKAARAGGRRVAEVAGAILRSESEDSGVETENAPSTPGSLSSFSQAHGPCDLGGVGRDRRSLSLLSSRSSLDTAPPQELDPPTPSQEPDPPAPPQEPDRPAPPPWVRVEEALRRATQTGERIPRRAAFRQRPITPPPLRADPQLHTPSRLRCRSLTSPARSGQRSGDLGLRTAVHPPPAPQETPDSPELCDFAEEPQPRPPQPGPPQPCSSITETDSRSQLEEEPGLRSSLGRDLSPGLGYLEQVCRMLEEIARLQLRNRELQRENQRAQNRQDAHGCQCLSVPPENPVGVRHSPDTEGSEGQSSQPSQAAQRLPPHIRLRSMSDVSVFSRSKGEVERQSSWKETVMQDECDGHFPSAQQQQGRIQLVLKPETDRAAALQEPLRKPAIPAGKSVPKKIEWIFRKMAKNKPTG